MVIPNIAEYVQLGGQVVVVVLFLNYLSKKDKDWSSSLKANSDANILLALALQRLTDAVLRNTITVKENVPAVSDNTDAVKKNTEIVKKTNGNH